jgi:GTPase
VTDISSFLDQEYQKEEEKTQIGLLPEEQYFGNIEYKLKIDPTNERLQGLVTQMNFRFQQDEQGEREAIYVIGVMDDGYPIGLSKTELLKSLRTFPPLTPREPLPNGVEKQR